MAITSRQRPSFYRNAVLFTTAVFLGLIGAFAAYLGVYHPEAAESIGYGSLSLLVAATVLAGTVLHNAALRSAERSLIAPLQRITDVTQSIV